MNKAIPQQFVQQFPDKVQFIPPVGFNKPTELRGLDGLWETVDTAPTLVPRNPFEQFKIYQNSTTYRLYIYDNKNNAWRYCNLT